MSEHKKKLRWFVALSALPLLGVVTAFGLVPQDDFDLATNRVDIEHVALPKVSVDRTVADYWRNERVQRGDTVDELLRRLSVDDPAASEYLRKSADALSFRKLPAGTEVQAEITGSGGLIAMSYLDNDSVQTTISRLGDGFRTTTLPAQLETRLFVRTGEIKTSLYAATDAAGLPDAAANQLSDLFSGDIDFHHDLRKGDRFTVVYEMTYSNGALLHMGRIQAAEFVNQGHTYRALYFQKDAQQHGDYFTPDGKSVHKAFLRSPIAYTRVSSSFSLSRFHPILKRWRSHKGTDFAAPMGTRVKVTADGIVAVVGREGGYGNVIIVNHQGRYTTVYGHLSRFAKGLHRGQHVAQGEVIGYVGMTGLATGPHLHYEFRVNGQQRDPLRVALPDAKPIDSADLAAFQPVAEELVSRLNLLRNTNLAQLD